jgi:ribonuclease Z
VRLTVLGSGSAWSTVGGNACYCLDGRLLIDCGAPAHLVLPQARIAVDSIDVILLTHFHADHTYMLPLLLGARGLGDHPRKPLRLAGPPGTRDYVLRVLRTGYGQYLHDLVIRNLGLETVTLQDGSDVHLGDYRVRANAVVHSTGPSLSYAITGPDGATVGFSGDSVLCAGLRRTTAASQVMVCECTDLSAPIGSHMWRGDVETLIRENPATTILISHLTQRGSVDGALVAHDLLSLDVHPPGMAPPEPPAAMARPAASVPSG